MRKSVALFIIPLLILPLLINLPEKIPRTSLYQTGREVLDQSVNEVEQRDLLIGQNIRDVFSDEGTVKVSDRSLDLPKKEYTIPHELAPPKPGAPPSILNKFHNSMPYPGEKLEPSAVTGTVSVLVLLLEFQDVRATQTTAYFQNLIFGTNLGQMNHYYWYNSYGALNVQGLVNPGITGWLRSSRNMAWYGADAGGGIDNANGPIYLMVQEAVQLADPFINFANYDNDGPDGTPNSGDDDGFIDYLIVVHAGNDQAGSWVSTDIWSHKWAIYPSGVNVDGVNAFSYTTLAETSPMGTFAHEFGHDIGLPDTYDTSYNCWGAGYYDLMAGGAWNGQTAYSGDRPARFMAWSLEWLGWITPTIYNGPTTSYTLYPISSLLRRDCLKLLDTNSVTSPEYWLVEFRDCANDPYDLWIPGAPQGGLLIWHVDTSVGSFASNNLQNNPAHKHIDLEEADQLNDLDSWTGGNGGDAGDWWQNTAPGVGMDDLTVKPASFHTYLGTQQTGYAITGISAYAPQAMLFTLTTNIPVPPNPPGKSFGTAIPILPYGSYGGNLSGPGDLYYFYINPGTWRPGQEMICFLNASAGTNFDYTFYDDSQISLGIGAYGTSYPDFYSNFLYVTSWSVGLYIEVTSVSGSGDFTITLINRLGDRFDFYYPLGDVVGGTTTGTLLCTDDLFIVEVSGGRIGSTLDVSLTQYGGTGADFDLYLFNANDTTLFSGAVVSSVTLGTANEQLQYTMLTGPGYYGENSTQNNPALFFVVIHCASAASPVQFQLTIGFAEGDTENNPIAISTSETKSTSMDCPGDIVFFRMYVSTSDTYHFDLSSVSGMLPKAGENFDLFLCEGTLGDNFLDILYYSTGQGIDESFAYHCSVGYYYLVVISFGGLGSFELTTSTNQMPSVLITSPATDDILAETVQITWSASDPEDDFLTFDLEISTDTLIWIPLVLGTVGNSYNWDTTQYADGNWWVRVTATDGGDSIYEQVQIEIDNIAPIITLNSPTEGSNVTAGTAVSISITDPNLDTVYYSWNGGANSTELSTIPDINGTVTLDVYAVDTAGNWAHEQFSWNVEPSTTPTTSTGLDIFTQIWFWIVIGCAAGLIVIIIVVIIIVRGRKKKVAIR